MNAVAAVEARAERHEAGRDDDLRFMQAALALGRRGLGTTAPNPAVGALVVREGVVIGRGVTAPGGRPHAEPQALHDAGARARGATLYVTLEPCSHHGRTPPCVDDILAAGLARVVVALEDPDPRVAGRGLAILAAADMALTVGLCAGEARRAHLGHVLRVTRGRPMVTVKLAATADGFAAGAPGSPRLLITGDIANSRVQMMRAMHDAVMVGIGTALADDPLLTARLPGLDRRPVRIVVDTGLALPPASRLARSAAESPVLVLAGEGASPQAAEALARQGVEILRLPCDARGRVGLAEALAALGRRGITRVLCEGGPGLAAALLERDLVDEIVELTSPMRLGESGLPALTSASRALLGDASRYRALPASQLGCDRLDRYERVIESCLPAW